jgi:elongation factor G
MIRDRLKANAVPVQLPIGAEADFVGEIDLIKMKAEIYHDQLGTTIDEAEIPENMRDIAEEYHQKLIESVAETDEELMEKFFDGEELTVEEIKSAIRKQTIANKMVPVFCGSAYKNKGVQLLLDGIVDYMPSPLDIPPIKGVKPKSGEEDVRKADDKEPFAALAFKIMADPFIGKLAFFRVYSGTLESGSYVYNATKGKRERIGRIVRMHANHREEIDMVYAGDIAAAVGLKDTTTGDTLCNEGQQIILESMEFPDPVIQIAIEPKTKAGLEKMGIALAKLAEEDPTFKTYTDPDTGQTIIAGMGELHLEIIVDRLKEEFKVPVTVGAPSVSFRETITSPFECNYRYVKQTGGKGQFAHTVIRFEPNPGGGFEFVDITKGGVIPKEYIPSVQKGLAAAMNKGPFAGYPVVDVKCVLVDGSSHPVDSSDMAFQLCAQMCFKQAFMKASPVLLEPVMKVEINTPDDYIGNVTGDVNKRRGRIEAMRRFRKGSQKLDAFVPLMEMFGYATALRNLTSGRANYSMEFHQYMPTPKDKQEEIVKMRNEKE